MRFALTRAVSPSLESCELTHIARTAIDAERAAAQHAEYERLLEELGCTVVRIAEADPSLPDAVFIEDTALILDELAVLLRPGAPSRRGELPAVRAALLAQRTVRAIETPATIDGGDVLRVGRRLFVGLSTRTTAAGMDALRAIVEPHDYHVTAVPVRGCLHLKSAATAIAEDALLMNPAWVDTEPFAGLERVAVDEREPAAANALRIGDAVILAAASPRTAERLASRGLDVWPVDVSELAKAEGGVTCCSLILERSAR